MLASAPVQALGLKPKSTPVPGQQPLDAKELQDMLKRTASVEGAEQQAAERAEAVGVKGLGFA